MKRSTPAQPGSGSGRSKRPKPILACDSCRKHKTRCEPPTEPGGTQCHRCKVLKISCSLEGTAALATPAASTSTPGLSPAAREDADIGPVEPAPAGPSRLKVEPPAEPQPEFNASVLTAEDLVFLPSSPDYFVGRSPGGADWTGAPMTAMAELLRRGRGAPDLTPDVASLGDVLSEDDVKNLLNIFEVHYAPWLNIPPLRTSRSASASPSLSDFLTLARCAIAVRNLPGARFDAAHPRLQKAAEHAVLRHTFDPVQSASLEAVQALLILSMWSPAIGPMGSEIHDGGLVATGAAKMARALRLDAASEKAIELKGRANAGLLKDDEQYEYEDLMFKARLWCSVCNAEWLLCLGTPRVPISARSASDMDLNDWRLYPGADTQQDARDYRLDITSELLEGTRRGTTHKFTTITDFAAGVDDECHLLDGRRNMIMSVIPMAPHEGLQMQAVLLQLDSCRLLVYLYGLAQLRRISGGHVADKLWLQEVSQIGATSVRRWVPGFVAAAQTIVISFADMVERHRPVSSLGDGAARPCHPLSSAPDHFYGTILFAASSLLVARYTGFRQQKALHPIYFRIPARLLLTLADSLDAVALADHHAPRKCAKLVRELGRVWADKVVSEAGLNVPRAFDTFGRGPAARGSGNGNTHGSGSGAPPHAQGDSRGAHGGNQDPAVASQLSAERELASAAASAHGALEFGASTAASAGFDSMGDAQSGVVPASQPALGGYAGPLDQDLLPADHAGLAQLFDRDAFLDNEFWTLFMENMRTPGSG